MSSHILLGTDHIKVAKVHSEEPIPGFVFGTTAGRKQSIQKKLDLNEDTAAIITVPEGTLMMVADSHYGARAAHIAAEHMADLFKAAQGSSLRRLRYTHYMIDRLICKERRQVGSENFHPHCATTLVTGLLDDKQLDLVSSGDSRAWLVRDGELEDLLRQDDDQSYFLGDGEGLMTPIARILDKLDILDVTSERDTVLKVQLCLCEIHQLVTENMATKGQIERLCQEITTIIGKPFPIETEALMEPWHSLHLSLARLTPQAASHPLYQDDVLLLATDGIDAHESAVDDRQIIKLLGNHRKPLLKRSHKLIDATTGRRGGNDNVTVVVTQV